MQSTDCRARFAQYVAQTQETHMRTLIRLVVPIAAGALLAGCGSGGDTPQDDPASVTLTLASNRPPSEPDEALAAFAAKVKELSNGTVTVTIKDSWHLGEPDYLAATIKDVEAGKVDLGSVAVRGFDNADIDTFEPLIAPMLIDSHDTQQKVFDAGIPDKLLASLSGSGLVGLGISPGELRLFSTKGLSLADVASAQDLKLGFQESGVAEDFLTAVGASATRLPTSADISQVDGLEQQLDSIIGNSYYQVGLDHVLGNLPLWPRLTAMVANEEAYGGLTDDQQQALRSAWAATMEQSVATARETDEGAADLVCTNEIALDQATPAQVAAWRKAADEVTATISEDSDRASVVDEIRELKGDTPAEAFTCAGGPGDATTAALNGTYDIQISKSDLLAGGASEENANENAGKFKIVLDDGTMTMNQTYTDGPNVGKKWTGKRSYTYDGKAIHMKFDTQESAVIDAEVKVEADHSLTFRNVTTSFPDNGVMAVFQPMFTHWKIR
ncbi:MAG: TRAP transporter substrate-binding protein DctP [Marmoricola sp.]